MTTDDDSRLHPNPQMRKYQILAAGETVDLVYFGNGDAALLERGSVELSEGWVTGRDGSGNEICYPAHRVEFVQRDFEVAEMGEDIRPATEGEE